jgi:2-dehydropantoate 2-reductase
MAENKNDIPLRVGVVGMGPIGCTLAAHLAAAGAYVVACDIVRDRINSIKQSGIRVENKIEKQARIAGACCSVRELQEHDLDLAVVSVKAPSLKMVLPQLAETVSEKTFVMCAQNGLDNEREVASIIGDDRTLRMVVNYAGGMSAPSTVNMIFFSAPNYVASLAPAGAGMAGTIAELLSSVGLTTEVPDDIQHYIWEKAILNAALAPICAITRLTMKHVMEDTRGLGLVAAILNESIGIASAVGIEFPDDFRQFCIKYLKGGGDHKPSMAVDLENGLLTEIDYMNGKIAEYGEEHGLPAPVNKTITALVHLLEQGS